MREIYLIRHGQADLGNGGDQLSEVRRKQSELLGAYLRDQGLTFDVAITGSMERQQETARVVRINNNAVFNHISVDKRWNELDISGLFSEIIPKLVSDDECFRFAYEELTVQEVWFV